MRSRDSHRVLPTVISSSRHPRLSPCTRSCAEALVSGSRPPAQAEPGACTGTTLFSWPKCTFSGPHQAPGNWSTCRPLWVNAGLGCTSSPAFSVLLFPCLPKGHRTRTCPPPQGLLEQRGEPGKRTADAEPTQPLLGQARGVPRLPQPSGVVEAGLVLTVAPSDPWGVGSPWTTGGELHLAEARPSEVTLPPSSVEHQRPELVLPHRGIGIPLVCLQLGRLPWCHPCTGTHGGEQGVWSRESHPGAWPRLLGLSPGSPVRGAGLLALLGCVISASWCRTQSRCLLRLVLPVFWGRER